MCRGAACPIEGRTQSEVQVRPDKLEVVASICCLGGNLGMLSAGGGCRLVRGSLLLWKPPGRGSKSYYQISYPATSLTRPVAMCTVLACWAPCSMPVKLCHWPWRTCSACSAITGPWSDRCAVSSQRMWPQWSQCPMNKFVVDIIYTWL